MELDRSGDTADDFSASASAAKEMALPNASFSSSSALLQYIHTPTPPIHQQRRRALCKTTWEDSSHNNTTIPVDIFRRSPGSYNALHVSGSVRCVCDVWWVSCRCRVCVCVL